VGASGTSGIVSADALDRLVATGRSRAGLTSEDHLRGALPVGAMSAEDLALVVV
jgi:hypothetical protein